MSATEYDLALAVMCDDGWGCAITTAPEPPRVQYREVLVNGQLVRLYAREGAPVITDRQTGEQGIVMAEEPDGYWVEPIPGTASWTVTYPPVIPSFWPRLLIVATTEGA